VSKNKSLNWYKLDTSAKIYPAIESSRDPAVFRLSVSLTDKINPTFLLKALETISPRFPYYNVTLKKGLFWNYLQQNTNQLLIWPDSPSPCERIYPLLNNGYLYKIKYFNKTIALEIFHVLTDGFGAFEFLKSLIHQYLFLLNKVPLKLPGIIDILEVPKEDEYKDAFLTVLEQEKDNLPEKKRTLFGNNKIFQSSCKLLPKGDYRVITGIISITDLKKVSKKYNATITEFLAALYLEALIHLQALQIKNTKKHYDVAIQIPINMRKHYPTKCMRNFSLFVIPIINPQTVSNLGDIIAKIKAFNKSNLTKTHLLTMIDDNCSLATHKFIKHIPVDLKNLFISYINNTKGSSQFSGTISNLGNVSFPPQMVSHIKKVSFVPGPSPHEKCTCGVVGFNNNIYISFGRSTKDTFVEKYLFTQLVRMGVQVKLESTL